MLLHPLPDKQKLRALTGVEWGSGGERTLEERGGREGGREVEGTAARSYPRESLVSPLSINVS